MQDPAPLGEQTPVRDIMGQRVLERVFQVREQIRLEDKLGGLKMCETTAKCFLVLIDDRQKQCERNILSDYGRGLEQLLLFSWQPVDAGGQDRLDCGWDLHCVEGLGEAIAAALAHEGLGLHEGSDALF